jgi:hypothetical protein
MIDPAAAVVAAADAGRPLSKSWDSDSGFPAAHFKINDPPVISRTGQALRNYDAESVTPETGPRTHSLKI